jgi:hypothetical protein
MTPPPNWRPPEPVRFRRLEQLVGLEDGEWFSQYEPSVRALWIAPVRQLVWPREWAGTLADGARRHLEGLLRPLVENSPRSLELGLATAPDGRRALARLLDADGPGNFQERIETALDGIRVGNTLQLDAQFRFVHSLADLNHAFSRCAAHHCTSLVLKRWDVPHPGFTRDRAILWLCAIRITAPVKERKRGRS